MESKWPVFKLLIHSRNVNQNSLVSYEMNGRGSQIKHIWHIIIVECSEMIVLVEHENTCNLG